MDVGYQELNKEIKKMKIYRNIIAIMALAVASVSAVAQDWPLPHTDEADFTIENYPNGRGSKGNGFGKDWGPNVTGKFIYHLGDGNMNSDGVNFFQNGTITLHNGAVFILEICNNSTFKWAWDNNDSAHPCFFVVKSGAKLIVRRAPGYTGTLQFDGWAVANSEACIKVENGGVVEITNGKFVNFKRSTAVGADKAGYKRFGGALDVEGTLTLNDTEIWGCTSYLGGAIAVHNTGKAYINGGSIYNCTAGGRGGALFVSSLVDPTPDSSTGFPADNHGTVTCEVRGTKIYKNTANEWAGGVYVWWKQSSVKLLADGNGVKTDIYENVNNGHGGVGMVIADYAEATLGGVKIHDHEITTTDNANRGAGIYVAGKAGGAGKLYTDSTAEIYNNRAMTANGVGGGIYCADSSSLSISARVYNNQAASKGGGIYIDSKSSKAKALTISGGEITGNSCSEQGAGIYVNSGNVVLSDGAIKDNSTPSEGGGIYDNEGNIEIATDGIFTISGNEATSKGGGIYLNKGHITMNRWGQIMNNKSGSNGGAIYIGEGSFTGAGGSISENSSAYGGAIYISKGSLTLNPSSMSGGTKFSKNHASSDGGAVYIAEEKNAVTITAGTFTENTAGNDKVDDPDTWNGWGGAIYVKSSASTVTINYGTFNGNKASKGGAFYINAPSTTVNVADIEIKNCRSKFGAAMFIEANKNATVNLNGGLVQANIATWNGGAFFVDNGNSLNLTGMKMYGNCSLDGKGGAVFAKGASAKVVMSGGELLDNWALLGGGIALADGVKMTYKEGGTIRMNNALCNSEGQHGFGGGIWLGHENSGTDVTTLTFDVNTANAFGFYGNYAEGAGDDIYTTGERTKIIVPDISNMDLRDYSYAHDKLYWVEDYRNGDPDYSKGTQKNNTGVIERYRQSLANYNPTYSVRDISSNTPLQTKYLALALGFEMRTIVIRREGLIPGENAVYFIKSSNDSFKQKVAVLGTESTVDQTVVKGIPSGEYTVTESDWTWYKTDATAGATVRTQNIELEPVFSFSNAHKPLTDGAGSPNPSVPVHDESHKID